MFGFSGWQYSTEAPENTEQAATKRRMHVRKHHPPWPSSLCSLQYVVHNFEYIWIETFNVDFCNEWNLCQI